MCAACRALQSQKVKLLPDNTWKQRGIVNGAHKKLHQMLPMARLRCWPAVIEGIPRKLPARQAMSLLLRWWNRYVMMILMMDR